jgi:glycosyltransferase A (GT-A) superfamily protein (DUF2064 family)
VLIGGDCVSLGAAELRAAFDLLAAGQNAVLGPAADGGYVLIGLRQPLSGAVSGHRLEYAGSIGGDPPPAQAGGLDWAELPTGWDVDTPADLRRLRRTIRSPKYSACSAPPALPATRNPAAARLSA